MEMKIDIEVNWFKRYKRGFGTHHMPPVTATYQIYCDKKWCIEYALTRTGQLKGKSGNRQNSKGS